MPEPDSKSNTGDGFRHGALLYAGEAEFLAAATSFVREGLDAGEPAMVAVTRTKIAALRRALGADAAKVHFADMDRLGANPARIIPAWQTFLDERGTSCRPARGIGEPIWGSRRPDELVEAQQHECLLNRAFADADSFWLLCPYDTDALDDSVIAEARRSHPRLTAFAVDAPSGAYRGSPSTSELLRAPLAPAPAHATAHAIEAGSLGGLRQLVEQHALSSGAKADEAERFVIAVNEVAANSVRHAGGSGYLRLWSDGDRLACDVVDEGSITDPLVGRVQPDRDAESGRGLWIANQLCDLVQVRSYPAGNVVRLQVRMGAGSGWLPG